MQILLLSQINLMLQTGASIRMSNGVASSVNAIGFKVHRAHHRILQDENDNNRQLASNDHEIMIHRYFVLT